jgi:hypothetical protein
VGLFGVCTLATPNLSFPDADVTFAPIIACTRSSITGHVRAMLTRTFAGLSPPAAAKDAVKALLEEHKVDVIVAVTHISLPQDKELATKVPEIDVRTSAIHRTTQVNVSLSRALLVQIIIGGHDHVPYCLFEHKVFIMKVGQNAEYLGRIDINYTRNDLAKPNAQAREKGSPPCCFCQQLYRAVSESCFRCRVWCVRHHVSLPGFISLDWKVKANRGIPSDERIDAVIRYWLMFARRLPTC